MWKNYIIESIRWNYDNLEHYRGNIESCVTEIKELDASRKKLKRVQLWYDVDIEKFKVGF